MRLAILAVESNEMALRKAAQAFEVPKIALQRRLKKEIKNFAQDSQHQKSLLSLKTCLELGARR